MLYQLIQFLLQPLSDFLEAGIILHQMITEQQHKQFIRNLYILHLLTLSASVCVDSVDIFYTSPLPKIPSQPTHIVAFIPLLQGVSE